MPNFTEITSQEGLRATTVNIPTTGIYHIQGTLTIPVAQSPAASQGPGGGAGTGTGGAPTIPSQIVVTITQTGAGTILTTSAGDRGFDLPAVSCTAGDVITITPSSSLASDKQSNAVKLTLAVSGA